MNMKRIFLTLVLLAGSACGLMAQEASYALIDMQYLMGKIPAYKTATERIESSTKAWNAEIEQLNKQAATLYQKYQQDLAQLSAQDRVARENAIVEIEEEARTKQVQYFGPKGEVVKLQEQLIKPIQDQIYEAVKLISQRRGYLIVFDRASAGGVIIFADPIADISNDVLSVLGIK